MKKKKMKKTKSISSENSKNNWVKHNWDFLFIILPVFSYFIFKLFYFAIHIHPHISPDEITHFGISVYFSKIWFLPENGPETYSLGLITHTPNLYYYLMGQFIKLNFFPTTDLIFLRVINITFGLLTVWYAYRWIKLFTSNKLVSSLFFILMTNTLMFTFINAFVNYDNLTNLFAALSLYNFFHFFKDRNPNDLITFFICAFAGMLSKITFVPLAVSFFIILIIHEIKNISNVPSYIKTYISSLTLKRIILLSCVLILFILNLMLYLGNLIQYKKLVPNFDQVVSSEKCMENRIYARDKIVDLYIAGTISFEKAMADTVLIKHAGDRAAAVSMIQNGRLLKEGRISLLNHFDYFIVWSKLMLDRIYGIGAHISMTRYNTDLNTYIAIYFVFLFILIRKWSWSDGKGFINDSIFILLFYITILFFFINYPYHQKYGSIGPGLWGRYLFPVIIPLYGIMAYYFITPFKKPFQIIAFVSLSFLFIYGEFPYFLSHVVKGKWFF